MDIERYPPTSTALPLTGARYEYHNDLHIKVTELPDAATRILLAVCQ